METTSSGVGRRKSDFDRSKQICRCCLTTDKLMKNALEVQEYFMELAGINVAVADGMPPWVCVECSALMKKGITFKYKMLRAQSVLYEYLMRCPPGGLNPKDPDLTRYRAPHLSATRTLAFDSTYERNGFHDTLQVEKRVAKTDLYDVPLLPMFENPSAALDSVEAAFSDFEDDPLERHFDKKPTEDEKDNENENDDNENDNDDNDDENDNEEDDMEEEEDDEDIEEEEDFEEEDDDDAEVDDVSSDTDEEDSQPLVKRKKVDKRKHSVKAEITSSDIDLVPQQPPEMQWTSENDEILIEFVKRNESLYNPKSKVYRVGVLKKKLWIDIGAILNKSDVECCKRWNYVRDYYIRRRGKRASGGEAARRRAALLAFLDHVPTTARTGWAPRPPPAAGAAPPQSQEPVKEEGATNFEHLWEQIRIGDQYSKMSGVAWTSAKEELLIDFVRRHEALYNPRSKDFRKPQVKQKLWCDIGTLLNKSDTDCSKRWCYVRDYYTRRKSNPGALSTGKAAKRRAELLSFLDYVPPPGRPPLSPPHNQDNQFLKSELRDAGGDKPRAHYSDDHYASHSGDYRGTTYSKMSSNATWTNDHDEKLIKFVRRNESLFNPKSKDFRKARMKQKLWRDIGVILNKSDAECYKRWCYVRDYYIRRRGKAGVLSTGKAAKRRAELLSFLDDVPTAAKQAQQESEALKAERREDDSLDGDIADLVGSHNDYREKFSKATSNVTWTWENDETLIQFVRRNEPLYNPKSRNSQLKQKLWNDIAAKLNKSDSECCKRWCYVRDYYRRRSKTAPCGESARRRAALLAFLDAVPTVPRGAHAS